VVEKTAAAQACLCCYMRRAVATILH